MNYGRSVAVRRFHERLRVEMRAFVDSAGGPVGSAASLFRRLLFLRMLHHKGWLDRDPVRECLSRQCLRSLPNDQFFDLSKDVDHLHVPDRAFLRLSRFLDGCEWRLEDGPAQREREISPALLGLLFEGQINQRETGAYYTGDDVTRYLTRTAIVPFLLDTVAADCPVAFRAGGVVWRLLHAHPDRYVPAPLLSEGPLPTETEREIVARRGRVDELRRRLRKGEIHSANELIRCNLDLERFLEDIVLHVADPALRHAIRDALARITVLDPTCGTGAFLLVAADLLARVTEACLSRMQSNGPDRRAFILHSILSNNLFGVDRMGEAIEICRLRLYLKWVAACNCPNAEAPDLCRNLRVGNALVGEVRTSILAATPGAFHWPAEYPHVMQRGGFDVIVGNPPYLEHRPGRAEYAINGYLTKPCGNLWAFVLERCVDLARPGGRLALIVPLSLIAAAKMTPALRLIDGRGAFTSLLALSGDAHPGMLFDGVKMSYTLLTHQTGSSPGPQTVVSQLYRWLAEERPFLFSRLEYAAVPDVRPLGLCPRVGGEPGRSIFRKVLGRGRTIGDLVVGRSPHRLLYHRVVRHFVKCLRRPPYFRNDRDGEKVSEDYKEVFFRTGEEAEVARAALVSSTFYCVWFLALSDSYHCGRELILSFPLETVAMPAAMRRRLIVLGRRHEADLYRHARRRRIRYRTTGWVEYDEFYPRLSKVIADEIDRELAAHYHLTEEEVEYIVSCDLKYRMGPASAGSGFIGSRAPTETHSNGSKHALPGPCGVDSKGQGNLP
jgi:SAM-dependent methyltransferase